MKCILCILARMQDMEITNAEVLTSAINHAVDGAATAVTVTKGNALCNQHIVSVVLGYEGS